MKQREDVKFTTVWEKATAIAGSVGVLLSKPRTTTYSRFRSNAGSDVNDSPVEYYRRNVYYPFIDHCLQQFQDRFPDSSLTLFLGYKLLPCKLSTLTTKDINEIEKFYGPDLAEYFPNIHEIFHFQWDQFLVNVLFLHYED